MLRAWLILSLTHFQVFADICNLQSAESAVSVPVGTPYTDISRCYVKLYMADSLQISCRYLLQMQMQIRGPHRCSYLHIADCGYLRESNDNPQPPTIIPHCLVA